MFYAMLRALTNWLSASRYGPVLLDHHNAADQATPDRERATAIGLDDCHGDDRRGAVAGRGMNFPINALVQVPPHIAMAECADRRNRETRVRPGALLLR